jgi:malonyl CoA-acyl carrier protein transacylase
MMEPMLADFRKAVASVSLSEPTKPYLSNVSGSWITAAQATDPEYWVRHIRQAVRFSDNMSALLGDSPKVLLEVGPGRTLGSLASQHPARTQDHAILASLPNPNSEESDLQWIMTSVARLWLEGQGVRPDAFYANETRRRVSLPPYPFDRENYSVQHEARVTADTHVSHRKISDIGKWFHYPTWKRVAPLPPIDLPETGCALLFMDQAGLGEQMSTRLEDAGWDVIRVRPGNSYRSDGPISFTIRPAEKEDYEALLQQLSRFGLSPTLAVHLWSLTSPEEVFPPELECYQHFLDLGFMSMMHLAPNLSASFSGGDMRLLVAGNGLYDVTGGEVAIPTKATILGPCRATLAECSNLNLHVVDIELPRSPLQLAKIVDLLLRESFAERSDEVIAYRGLNRWLQSFDSLKLDLPSDEKFGLRDGGVYLITGGLGGIGLVIAEVIASKVKAKLALFSRTALPPRDQWLDLSKGDDLTAEKLRRLLRIEQYGAQVMTFSADVTHLEQMRAAVQRVESELGPLNGVFHSAGVAGGGVMLLKTREQMDQVIRPKVIGALILEELVKNKPLDFFHLCSSLNSFLGEGGISDYIGANAFVDAFAFSRQDAKTPPVSLQWDSWEDVGMVAEGWFNGVKIDWDKHKVEILDHPLFESRITYDRSLIYTVHLDPARHWFIGEHVLMGTPTLVGTTNLQWARSAFVHSRGTECEVELRDVLFLAPLILQPGTTCDVEVALEPQGEAFGFAVRSRKPTGGAWVVHALGKVMEAPAHPPVTHDLKAILARCAPILEQVDARFEPNPERAPFLQFGDRWLNLRSTAYGNNEAFGEFRLKEEFHGDFEVFGMHPAMLDRATGFAVFKAGAEGAHYLPFAYNRVRISSPLKGLTYSHVRYEPGDEFVGTNVSLFDEDGRELMMIEGYEVKRVPQHLLDSNDAEFIASGGTSASANASEPQKPRIAARILSSDGAEVFGRLLNLRSMPQVAIACRDLRAVQAEIRGILGARTGKEGASESSKQNLYPRPALATSYVEPRNELEQAVAEIWGSMLGIEQVGVFDDFIELGGNSLLGIQIASRIRADFEIELSVATFYKSPTIATLAESILETLQGGLSAEELKDALDQIEEQDSPALTS